MRQIQILEIQDVLKSISQKEKKDFKEIYQEFQDIQPELLDYLSGICKNTDFSDEEKSFVSILALNIWQITRTFYPVQPLISKEKVFEFHEKNIKYQKNLFFLNDFQFQQALNEMSLDHPQKPLFIYISSIIMNMKSFQLPEKNAGIMLIYLKTLLESFHDGLCA